MNDRGTILVVDDTPTALKVLMDTLVAEGYQVRPANSGELALASVASNVPELILLDIRMPGMDGFEVCRRLKSREESSGIPVIFISALVELEDRVEGFRHGAVDFVTKPFQREELLARVRTHLALHRLTAALEQRTAQLQQLNSQLQNEILERTAVEEKLADKVTQLEATLARVKQLEGIIPICMYCKKIRDDKDSWSQIEQYITEHSEALFSHGICPDCMKKQEEEFAALKRIRTQAAASGTGGCDGGAP
ncbi:response regulator [bacterium]|nr:response regulator [bacterium]